jgi:hypothetical protein
MNLLGAMMEELKNAMELLKEEIEGAQVVLQKKNIPANSENVLQAAQIMATNRLASITKKATAKVK